MKKLLLAFLMSLPIMSYAQGGAFTSIVFTTYNQLAKPIKGAQVRVCAWSSAPTVPCSPASSLYTDVTLTTPNPTANFVYTDAGGNFTFYATPGTYNYQVSYNGGTSTNTVTLAGGNSMGLGNPHQVIDVSLKPGYPDFYTMTANAIAACSPGPCSYDYRGLNGTTLTMSQSITYPSFSEVRLPQATITPATGVQFLLLTGVHIHGDTAGGSIINKVNTTNDYTAAIYSASQVNGVELDHLTVGNTTPSGAPMIATSTTSSSGGFATVTGAFTPCNANACAGYEFGFWGFRGLFNDGYYMVTASTSTTVTIASGGETAESVGAVGIPPALYPYLPYVVQSGAWGIQAPFINSNLHDIHTTSDLGLRLTDSGCTCYNSLSNLTLFSNHGALYLGSNANSNNLSNITAWGTDQNNVGYLNAFGYGVSINQAGSVAFNGLDVENTKYPLRIKGADIRVNNFYLENDLSNNFGALGLVSLPIIQYPSHEVYIDPHTDVLDPSGSSIRNQYGHDGVIQTRSYGSYNLGAISNPSFGSVTPTCNSACSTTWYYAVSEVDWFGSQGSSPLGRTLPFQYAGVSNNATLSSTSFNTIGSTFPTIPSEISIACYDIYRSNSPGVFTQAIATCIPGSAFPFIDDGTFTPVGVTTPVRNSTADITTPGYIQSLADRNLPIATSALPACSGSNQGQHFEVFDSTVVSFNANPVGGGSNVMAVRCNGTSWVTY